MTRGDDSRIIGIVHPICCGPEPTFDTKYPLTSKNGPPILRPSKTASYQTHWGLLMRKALILVTLFFTVVYAGDATADSNKKEKKVAKEVCADGTSNHLDCKKAEFVGTPEEIKTKLEANDEMREAIITYYKTKVIVEVLQHYMSIFRFNNPEFAYASDKVIIGFLRKELLD